MLTKAGNACIWFLDLLEWKNILQIQRRQFALHAERRTDLLQRGGREPAGLLATEIKRGVEISSREAGAFCTAFHQVHGNWTFFKSRQNGDCWKFFDSFFSSYFLALKPFGVRFDIFFLIRQKLPYSKRKFRELKNFSAPDSNETVYSTEFFYYSKKNQIHHWLPSCVC